MVWQTLESKLSTPRMSRYLKGSKNKQARAAEAYVHNMKIAESLVSVFMCWRLLCVTASSERWR
jgi:hypothetical protein